MEDIIGIDSYGLYKLYMYRLYFCISVTILGIVNMSTSDFLSFNI